MPVYDQSYRHIGESRGVGRARWAAIAGSGFRLFFRKKRFLILGVFALAPFLLGMLVLVLPQQVPQVADNAGPIGALIFHLSGSSAHMLLTNPYSVVMRFLFTMLAGGGLIANDVRANALEIYFSRPITRVDYLLGKLFVLLAILLGLSLAPMLVLWIFDVSLSVEDGYLVGQTSLLLRLVGASLLLCVPFAMVMLAVSALARTARGAMVFYAGVLIVPEPVSEILMRAFREPAWGVLSLNRVVHRLCADMLGADFTLMTQLKIWEPELDPTLSPLAWAALAAWLMASLVVVFRRVRPIEVIAG